MKTLACIVLASCALSSPVVSFAHGTAPDTRAQVRAELIRLEQAGYHVGDGDQTKYPEPIQAAEAKIAAQDSQQAGNRDIGGTTTNVAAQESQQADNSDAGGTTDGTSASGGVRHVSKPSPSSCVGPASYCNLFFGN
ncbi:DUF4148 domain-containing protein [Paraburkholderia youngii]|uniref:DUF4148 domain-containing protein n=1 Tax=Paraburkholderia youngii TaxID=2782701 RepID=A0A7Y6N4A0_9BURK|nr:DUF4148 domain-containing protein [Paraburkholderia youngii]NUY05161.1 DUF4148 domain-containing protein [Paraburkholderia youngii]